jgi:signal transduction histidine kinase
MGARPLSTAPALTAAGVLPIGRPGRFAIAALGLAFAIWAEWLRLAVGWPLDWVIVDLVPGLAFLLAGLIAWERRPDSRIGAVMMLVGFAWFPGTLAASTVPIIDRLGNAFQGYYDGLLAWLVLAYPVGRLTTRAARTVIGIIFGVLIARTLFRLATFRMSIDYDFSLPGEADRYVADLTLRDTGDAAFRLVLAALMVVVLVLLVRRLVAESELARRIGWPMILAGIALAAGVVLEVATVLAADTPSERFGAWALGDLVTAVTGSAVALAFAVGLVRGRLARQSVADLVTELGGDEQRAALRDVVARALRDPTLELLYPGEGGVGLLDAAGRERRMPASVPIGRSTTTVEANGRTLAVLVHDSAIAEQPELLRSVVAAVRLAMENERLAAEVREQLGEVQASRARIVAAGDEQRRRIERDLHDGAQQRLVTLALRLEMARAAASNADGELGAAIDAASRELEGALTELRELARGLHPPILATDGLRAAVEGLAERAPLPVTVEVAEARFGEAVETTAYFVVAEALTNVARYAGATTASVSAKVVGGTLRVEIADDGVGGADAARGSGLRGLEDRVAAIGGRFTVDSPRAGGGGTRIVAELPCD